MPTVAIYIRRENEDKWRAIADKSKWVNDALGGVPPNQVAPKAEPQEDRPLFNADRANAFQELKATLASQGMPVREPEEPIDPDEPVMVPVD